MTWLSSVIVPGVLSAASALNAAVGSLSGRIGSSSAHAATPMALANALMLKRRMIHLSLR